MKRLIPLLSLFLLMCFIGAGASVFLAQDAMACEHLSNCDGDCTPLPKGPLFWLSCYTGAQLCHSCPAETPYAVIAIYSACSGSGYCQDYEVIGCHAGTWCE